MTTQLPALTRRETGWSDAAIRTILTEHLEFEFAAMPPESAASLIEFQVRARIGGLGAGHPHARAWVIESAGHPLGYALVDERGNELRLVDLVVRPTARRRGVATSVLDELTARADASGSAVTLTVQPGGEAERLYLRHGFTAAGDDGDDPMHRVLRRPATEGTR
jgi:ribosomal protein S18 acetylase RimI-like enzyme